MVMSSQTANRSESGGSTGLALKVVRPLATRTQELPATKCPPITQCGPCRISRSIVYLLSVGLCTELGVPFGLVQRSIGGLLDVIHDAGFNAVRLLVSSVRSTYYQRTSPRHLRGVYVREQTSSRIHTLERLIRSHKVAYTFV